MTTRVIGPNEVFLNDTFFPVVGRVRSSIASNYPQKRITGDFDKDSQRRVSVFTWDDQRGGMGVDRMSLAQGDRCTETGWDIRHRGHIIRPPTITTITGTGQTAGTMIINQLGSNIVSANATDVQDWDGTSWTSRHTLNATPTDSRNGNVGGTEYLVYCYTSGYAYSSAIATWAVNNSQNTLNVEFWQNRLWGLDATGQLWYTFTPGSAEVNDAQINLENGEVVTGLLRARDHEGGFILYGVTSRGLYAHDLGNRKFVSIEGIRLPNNNVVTHERPAVVWRERIYLAAGPAILEYDPIAATVRDVGFDLDDGVPSTINSNIACLAASYNELFAGGFPVVAGTDAQVLFAWDGRGWREVAHSSPATNDHTDSFHVGSNLSTTTTDELWYETHDGSSFRLTSVRINQSSTRVSNISGWTYAGVGTNFRHLFPVFDAGQADVTKILLKLKVEMTGGSDNVGLKVTLVVNGSATALTDTHTSDSTFDATLDRIEGDGVTTFLFPSVATPSGTEFLNLQILFLIDSGPSASSTDAVDVTSVTIEYLKVLDEKLAFDFEINLTEEHDGKSPEQLRASYATARALKTLAELTYRDDTGGTRNYYVKVFADQGEEESGHEERGTELVRCEEI